MSISENMIFSLDDSTFSNIEIERSWEEWTYEEVSKDINNYMGEKIDKHTIVLKNETKNPAPPGKYPPGLRFGESEWNNYSVEFDICYNGAEAFSFIMYDETNLLDPNANGNVQRYWFRISRNGDLTYETTLGTDIEYLYDNDTKLTVKDFTPDLWNHFSLETVNNYVVLFVNGNEIGKIDTHSTKSIGKFALDGSSGLMIKDLRIYQ